jgi:N-acetylglucosaminyldiphosphoundecaprenol N-acetyl-beta-D-mannosaminyltransferase
MMRLIGLCAREGYRPYFLGARQDALEQAIARARLDHPGLDVAGWRHGYFDSMDEAGVVAEIRAARADCLFVGMSSPIQDRFLNQYRDILNVPVQVGVGGSFDVLAGRVRRAPIILQKCGLEWFFRFAQEPTRLWRRYLVTNTAFAFVMALAVADRFRQYIWTWRKQGI